MIDKILSRINPDLIVPFLSVFVFLIFLLLFIKFVKGKSTYNYQLLPALFSPAEKTFYFVLKQALSDSFEVFGKVRIADVITPVNRISRKSWRMAFNRISSKHFDYVICDKNTLAVLAVIELDDKSHNRRKVKARDNFVQRSCDSANLNLIRFKAKAKYSIKHIRETINDSLNTYT